MASTFIIIGMDDNPSPIFTPAVLEHITHGTVFSGGLRHHDIVSQLLPADARWIPITVPLSRVFDSYRELLSQDTATIVIFASGDPLFFGFANTVKREIPEAAIRLYPAFNSLQTLAHRLVMRYDDMRIVSLTGRPWQELDRALIERASKIGVLTDRGHTPATIAQRLLEYGYRHYNMHIGERLGNPAQERIRTLMPEEAATSDFSMPNCLILEDTVRQNQPISPRPFGIPDEAFEHLPGRPRMITKAPIRLLTLQALELPQRTVLWDIGFCTGSVSIEARVQFPHLTVVAFEIRPESEKLMQTNSRRFGVPGIQAVIGDFLQTDTTALPQPDAIFIGGHGGHLEAMLQKVRQVLLPGGCVVFNSVSAESAAQFTDASIRTGLSVRPSLHIALNDYNPIDIMKATAD